MLSKLNFIKDNLSTGDKFCIIGAIIHFLLKMSIGIGLDDVFMGSLLISSGLLSLLFPVIVVLIIISLIGCACRQ